MKSAPETFQHIQKRIKPIYNAHEVDFLRSYVLSGLKTLKDVGKGVNYEDMCDEIMAIPERICAPEWVHYWEYWKNRFQGERNQENRNSIFNLCIEDLIRKGLLPLPEDITGLTGNFHARIHTIIERIGDI